MSIQIPRGQHSPKIGGEQVWQPAETLKYSNEANCKRMGESRFNQAQQLVSTFAMASLAMLYLHQLKPVVNRHVSADIQAAIKIIVIITGGFTFSLGMRLITSGLGIWAVPTGFLGGALASFALDRLVTEAFTSLKIRLNAQQRLDAIDYRYQEEMAQHQDNLPLLESFYQAQRDLTLRVESVALQRSLPIRIMLALPLSCIEFSIALFVVESSPTLAKLPLVLRGLVALLPVVLTYVAALGQAIAFNVPDYTKTLVEAYSDVLEPHPSWSQEEIEYWRLDRIFEGISLLTWVNTLLDRHPVEPDPTLAELGFQRQFFNQGIEQLKTQAQEAVHDRWISFDQEVQELAQGYQTPPIDSTQLTELEIEKQRQHLKQQRHQWLDQETQRLRETAQRDVVRLQEEYRGVIALWETALIHVHERYQQGYKNFRQRNDGSLLGTKDWDDQENVA